MAFEEGLNYESGTFVTASSLGTSLFLVRHPFQRGFNQTIDTELKIRNYKYENGPAIPLRSWNSQFRYLPETVCGSNFTIRWFPVETTHPIIS